MFNVPMYRNTNNIAFGVSVLIVLESLLTILYRDIESRLSSPYSTGADDIKTKMKRGSVETRTRMRTQDPRLAPLTKLAAKDRTKERLVSA